MADSYSFSGVDASLTILDTLFQFMTASMEPNITFGRVEVCGKPAGEPMTYGTIAPTGKIEMALSESRRLQTLLASKSVNGTVFGGLIPSISILDGGGSNGMPLRTVEMTQCRLKLDSSSRSKGDPSKESYTIESIDMKVDGKPLL